jgi:V/A-type H+-transporting ATPase subunit A
MLAGRLLREAVLQQSSLSANDAFCAPAKQRSLLELALRIHDVCADLVGRGVAVARIEEVDLSPATRARDATGPDDAAAVGEIGERLLAALWELG